MCAHLYKKWNRSLILDNQLVRTCLECGEIIERDVVTQPFNPDSIGGQLEPRELENATRSHENDYSNGGYHN